MAAGTDGAEHVLLRSAYLNVVMRQSGRVIEIALDGEVDLVSREGLTNVVGQFDSLISSDGATNASVVVDMSGVSFCDGSGVAFLVGMQAKSKVAGSNFAVREASPIVRRLLRILDLDAMLEDGSS